MKVPALFLFLLAVDIFFISVHSWLWVRGLPPGGHMLSIERDGGIPEVYNYAKWLASAVACTVLFVRGREKLFLSWSALFTYFLVDDSFGIHEHLGKVAVVAFELTPALLLRAQDFGELAVNAAAGALLFGAMAMLYARTSEPSAARKFTRRQLPSIGVLVFCGVVIDLVHVQVGGLRSPLLLHLCGVLEDGGEMIAASLLTAVSVCWVFGPLPRICQGSK